MTRSVRPAGNRLVGVIEPEGVMDAWLMSSTPLRTMLMSRALEERSKVPVVFEASRSAAG
jgi:maleate cis-trans isomerase